MRHTGSKICKCQSVRCYFIDNMLLSEYCTFTPARPTQIRSSTLGRLKIEIARKVKTTQRPPQGHANLDMYDLQGRRVIRLLSGEFAAGEHSAIWNGVDEAGRTVASGVYLARLQLGGIEFTRSLVVMK